MDSACDQKRKSAQLRFSRSFWLFLPHVTSFRFSRRCRIGITHHGKHADRKHHSLCFPRLPADLKRRAVRGQRRKEEEKKERIAQIDAAHNSAPRTPPRRSFIHSSIFRFSLITTHARSLLKASCLRERKSTSSR